MPERRPYFHFSSCFVVLPLQFLLFLFLTFLFFLFFFCLALEAVKPPPPCSCDFLFLASASTDPVGVVDADGFLDATEPEACPKSSPPGVPVDFDGVDRYYLLRPIIGSGMGVVESFLAFSAD